MKYLYVSRFSKQLRDPLSQITAYVCNIDLKYAFSQLNLHPDTAKHYNFFTIRAKITVVLMLDFMVSRT